MLHQADRILHLVRKAGPARLRQVAATLGLMLLGAIAELVTIGAVLPFLALVAQPEKALPDSVGAVLGFVADDWLIAAASILIAAAIAAAALRTLLASTIQRTVSGLGHDMAVAIFRRMLRQPFEAYLHRQSSEILAGIEKVQNVIYGFLQPVLLAMSAAVIALFVTIFLFLIDPFAASLAAVCVVAVYAIVSAFARRRLAASSMTLSDASKARIKIVQEGLGGIRDILIDRSQRVFEEQFRQIDASYREAQATISIIVTTPRYIVETAGIVALALVTIAASFRPGGVADAIPVLGALALGAQRLLPLFQQCYTGWGLARGNFKLLSDVLTLMEAPVRSEGDREAAPLPFDEEIAFESVSFSYRGTSVVLSDLDLRIRKGSRIGISGTTGSGKSTLVDLLMGLLEPTSGLIRIDGRVLDSNSAPAWQARLAHVPQFIFLSDDTVAANIAFGEPADRRDMERMQAAARAAQAEDFVLRLPGAYATPIGEHGIRLSGGQRQRLGIARALYKGASVLILDEATSALDDQTEAAVMRSIMALDERMTIVMVAHRLSTLAKCDMVVRLDAGGIAHMQATG